MTNLTSAKGRKQQLKTGVVVSTRMNKTVVVAVTHAYRHPLYKKHIRRTRRFAAHNENSTIQVGDKVTMVQTRPISKTKHFIIVGKLATDKSKK